MDIHVAYDIVNLRECSSWIPDIAAWHHAEWVKGLPEKVNMDQQRQGVLGKDVYEREHNLRAHLSEEVVPTTFIAVSNASPIGSVSLVNYQFSREQYPKQWITNLFVLEHYRCQGLGQKLLFRAVDFAVESGLRELYLYTRDLAQYYEKRGWLYSHEGVVQGQKVAVLKKLLR